jgi:hypothetical protein
MKFNKTIEIGGCLETGSGILNRNVMLEQKNDFQVLIG